MQPGQVLPAVERSTAVVTTTLSSQETSDSACSALDRVATAGAALGDRAPALVSLMGRATARTKWSAGEAGSSGPRPAARRPTLNVPSHVRNKAMLHRRIAEEKAKGSAAEHSSAGSSTPPPCFRELCADLRGEGERSELEERGADLRGGGAHVAGTGRGARTR